VQHDSLNESRACLDMPDVVPTPKAGPLLDAFDRDTLVVETTDFTGAAADSTGLFRHP
jgi:hypothetical protein